MAMLPKCQFFSHEATVATTSETTLSNDYQHTSPTKTGLCHNKLSKFKET